MSPSLSPFIFLHTRNPFFGLAVPCLLYLDIWGCYFTDNGVEVINRKGENVILEDEDEEDDGLETYIYAFFSFFYILAYASTFFISVSF